MRFTGAGLTGGTQSIWRFRTSQRLRVKRLATRERQASMKNGVQAAQGFH